MLYVQTAVTALHGGGWRRPGCAASDEFFVGNFQFQPAFRDVQFYGISVLHQCKCAAQSRFGCGVQHDGAEGGAAHSGVGDTDHIADTFFQDMRRQRHISHLCHPGITPGTTIFEHHNVRFIDIKVRIINSGLKIFDVFKHHRLTAVDHQFGRSCRRFNDRPVRTQIAAQHRQSTIRCDRVRHGADDFPVVTLGISGVFSHSFAIHGNRILVDKIRHFTDDRRQTAGIKKILHQVVP